MMPPQVEAANSRYIYQPILQSNSIRLLTLFPGTKGTTIQCELQEVSLSNNRPPYCALSYVWGDPSVTAGIRVHCRELQVTTNLQSALQCLRLCDTSRILWIDAICIDQGNLTERNEQIQYMVQIYSLAANVLIWLGNDDSIHHAFNIVKDIYQTCHKEEANKAPDTGMAHPSTLAALASQEDPEENPNLERLVEKLSEDDYMHLGAAFNDNSWWSRAWVIQEVIHASEVSIFCGTQSISWEIISEVVQAIAGQACTLRLGFTIGNAVRIWLLRTYKIEWSRDLDYLLETFGHKSCTDPRDHIFAFLSLSDGSCQIQPDYTKTVSRVYLESTTALIKSSKHLKKLYSGYTPEILNGSRTDHRSDEIIPSWVPDWSSHRSSVETDALAKGYFSACTWKLPDNLSDTFPPEWPWLLRLRGVMFDTVATTFPKITTTSPGWKSELLAWLPEILDRGKFPTGEVVSDAVWRTLLKDLSRDPISKLHAGERIPESERPRYRELFRHWCGQEIDLSNITEEDIEVFDQFLAKSLNEHVVFITERGYIGLTLGSVKRDDRLYVVSGATVPFLLRKEEQNFRDWSAPTNMGIWHALVGGSYVHGTMDGEVMKMAELKNELICLV